MENEKTEVQSEADACKPLLSLSAWRKIFIYAELILLCTLSFSIYALSQPDLAAIFIWPSPPSLPVVTFGLFHNLATLFLLCAGPVFFRRLDALGVLARWSFATALLSLLFSFVVHD